MSALRPGARLQRVVSSVLLVVYSAACTSWHTSQVAPESFLATHHPGKIRLILEDGSRVKLPFPVIRGDSIVGRKGSGAEGGVPLSRVRAIQARKANPSATAALVVGLGLVAGTFICAAICNVGLGQWGEGPGIIGD